MALAAGSRLGPYEVTAALGAGGMGEVYRARDTKLGREVAVKTLPSALARDADRLARFEREAKLLASLNHAHIASIYGLDEHEGTLYLAMELIEGATLEDKLLGGALPVEEALRIALQIALGLEAAHEKGVIHRDLKPANVMLTRDGQVKILDFGLAKAFATEPEQGSPAHSPALSLAMTQQGLVLGTAGYMSPEQASGQATDQRADVWSFGVVLYEMLTGKPLFGGESVPHILADVLRSEPNWDRLPKDLHPRLKLLLERCLEKKARNRYHGIADARVDIEKILADPRGAQPKVPTVAARRAPLWTAAAVAGFLAIGAAAAALWLATPDAGLRAVPTRFAMTVPDGTVLGIDRNSGPNMAVSPDGRLLVFTAQDARGQRTLWVRALDSLAAQQLVRTEGAYFPFWSPDSQHIGYFANRKLMRIPVTGGAPLTLADADQGVGGAWLEAAGQDGSIVFATTQLGPLHRVPAMGGIPVPVTTLGSNETGHAWPQALPDGRLMFTGFARDASGVYVQSLGAEGKTRVLQLGTRAVYAAPGFLLYAREGVLLAQRFDLATLSVESDAVAIADEVRSGTGTSAFAVASGAVAYRRGFVETNTRVRWYGRGGEPGEVILNDGDYAHLELSPDGRLLAVAVAASLGERDLWVKDLASGTFQRLTSQPGTESQQVWSPDSRQLAYMTGEGLAYTELGSGRQSVILGGGVWRLLHSWTPDGAYLLGNTINQPGVIALPAPAADGQEIRPGAAQELLADEGYATDHFRVSPDGRWVAYTSQESGRPELMVAAFPSFTSRRQISLAGGTQPQWRADGRELYFHATDMRIMAVDVTPGDALQTGPPRQLFRTNPAVLSNIIFMYAAAPDGQRFILVEPVEGVAPASEPLYVLTNWQALLGAE